MGLFDRSAFPEHLDTQEEVDAAFPDDSQYGDNWFGRAWKWVNKQTKHWAAFGPRSPAGIALMVAPIALLFWLIGRPIFHWSWTWWALWPIYPVLRKWRPKPFVVFAVCGKGSWRLEKLSGGQASCPGKRFFLENLDGEYYLSRIQPWTRWHFAILWPLSIQFRVFFKKGDVLGTGLNGDTDGKSFFTYLLTHFDGDWIYWCPSAYVGTNSK